MTKTQKIIEDAYIRGYRVTDDGVLIGLQDKPLTVRLRGNQRYPTFSVSTDKTDSGVYGIPVHQFAAYCFYGKRAWVSECVRHLDGDVTNIAKSNILLGTYSENEYDKATGVRHNSAKAARAAQGERPVNARFTDDEVRHIRNSYPNKTYKTIAEEFNVTKQAIFRIVKGLNYGNVQG